MPSPASSLKDSRFATRTAGQLSYRSSVIAVQGMRDKYGTSEDPYAYPGTNTLRNLLHIDDADELAREEARLALERAASFEPDFDQLDFSGLRSIHRHLFQDVYDWAGEVRTIDISKGDTRFCTVQRIEPEALRLFSCLAQRHYLVDEALEDLPAAFADFYCELNVLHPFRDGNGRALRVYFETLAANRATEISWAGLDTDRWIQANVAGYHGELDPLTQIFRQALLAPG